MGDLVNIFKSLGEFLVAAWELSPLNILLLVAGLYAIFVFFKASRRIDKYHEYLADRTRAPIIRPLEFVRTVSANKP